MWPHVSGGSELKGRGRRISEAFDASEWISVPPKQTRLLSNGGGGIGGVGVLGLRWRVRSTRIRRNTSRRKPLGLGEGRGGGGEELDQTTQGKRRCRPRSKWVNYKLKINFEDHKTVVCRGSRHVSA